MIYFLNKRTSTNNSTSLNLLVILQVFVLVVLIFGPIPVWNQQTLQILKSLMIL
jgi:hypothetical protein